MLPVYLPVIHINLKKHSNIILWNKPLLCKKMYKQKGVSSTSLTLTRLFFQIQPTIFFSWMQQLCCHRAPMPRELAGWPGYTEWWPWNTGPSQSNDWLSSWSPPLPGESVWHWWWFSTCYYMYDPTQKPFTIKPV